jgi:hypothetical protein
MPSCSRTGSWLIDGVIDNPPNMAEAVEGTKRALADVDAGRVTTLEKFEKDFRKKHGIPRRSR